MNTLEDIKLAVIGLGYVGLPLAVEFGKYRNVVGFDINAQRISQLIVGNVLTPTGVAEKAVLTRRFLQRKMVEYEKLRGEIEALQLEADRPRKPRGSIWLEPKSMN